MTDAEFLAAFERGTLPKELFKHEGHLRMAWLYLWRLPYDEAVTAVRDGIQRYNAAVGGPPTAYHETVTRFYVHIVHHFMTAGPIAATWPAFREANPVLFDKAAPPTSRHYRRETLFSDEARVRFVEPDLVPLP